MSMILEMIPAALGTVAFAILFVIPRKYYAYCAAIGASGWLMYRVMMELAGSGVFEASFLATALVVLLSRFVSVIERCPATVFVTAGIFPLVPGAGICWSAYYLVTNQFQLAAANGFSALQTIVAVVLGIVFIFELPNKIFHLGKKK